MRPARFIASCLAASILICGAASAASITRTAVTPDGVRIARTSTEGAPPALVDRTQAPAGTRGTNTYLWLDRNHRNATAANVAISGDGAWGLAGWWLNNMRTAAYKIVDDNLPEWTYPMPNVQFFIPVASDRAADEILSTSRGDSLNVFHWSSGTPYRRHGYTPPLVGYHCAASDAGNTYASAGGNPDATAGEVRVYDGSGALRFVRPMPAPPEGISVSGDGLVVAGNVRGFVKIWDAMTGARRDSLPIPGETQAAAVLSGDGSCLVTGGFNKTVRFYQWNGANYAQAWSYNIPGTTWITAVTVSRDGSTIAAGTWTNSSPFGGKALIFDRSGPTPLWVDSSFGDEVPSVALSADGGILAAASWGRYNGTAGNVVSVYNRASVTPIWTIGDDAIAGVGSCETIDVSKDGRYVLAGGKALHERDFGSGGWVMAIALNGPSSAAEISPAGSGMSAAPNPFVDAIRISFDGPRSDARIVAADGRLVRVIPSAAVSGPWIWDGRDALGRPAPPGAYFVRAREGILRVIRVR